MRKYTPRRRRNNKVLQKQQLIDFEKILNMDLSSFLVLKEEGTPKQIESARVKMRSDLMKYGQDMEAIGSDLGEGFPEIVREYIKTMRQVVQNAASEIDPATLSGLRKQATTLRKAAA